MLHVVWFLAASWSMTAANEDPIDRLMRPLVRLQQHVLAGLEGSLDANVSVGCRNGTAALLDMARGGALPALHMIDSVGKPASGLMEGVQAFPGMYSECIGATILPPTNMSSRPFGGKYCLAEITVAAEGTLPQQSVPQEWDLLQNTNVGLCVPSLCTRDDIEAALSSAVSSLIPASTMKLGECSEAWRNPYSTDVGAIAVTSLLVLFLLLTIIGTIYDLLDGALQRQGQFSLWARRPISTNSVAITNLSSEVLCEPKYTAATENILRRVLKAFSLRTNSHQLLSTSRSSESIDAIHGIRFLTMVWIIVGHTFSYGFMWLFFRSVGRKDKASGNFLSQWLVNGTFSVDTFFFLSGFLVTYVTLKKMKQKEGKLNLLVFYIHRYIRLTPLMMAIIAICATLLQYVSQGPRWRQTILMYDLWCRESWWLNALYIQNFVRSKPMCLSHAWYSAVDMQFYWISPLIILPLYRNFWWGLTVWFCCLVGTTVTTATLTAQYHLPAIPYITNAVPEKTLLDYYRYVYLKPYCRMGPYLVGMALGYFIFTRQGSTVLKKKYVALGWFLAAIANLGVLYSMWPAYMGHLPTEAESAIYSALARTVWATSLAWLVFACISGYGGFINSWLSWRVIVPLSRLTYSAYLIHPVIVAVFYGSREQVFDFSIYFMVYLIFGNLFLTYLASLALSLLFESPFIALEKLVLGHG